MKTLLIASALFVVMLYGACRFALAMREERARQEKRRREYEG